MNASRTPERYYPLMAQAGTGKAIELLKNEHNDEATKAMLSVDNTDMLPVLAELAKAEEPGEKRDKILSRYLTLADKAQVNPTERYLLLSTGDELHPTESLRNRFISSIGKTHTLQSLSYMRKYYDTPAHIDAVAERVKETVAQNSDLNGGKNVTAMLHIAKSVYADKQIEDADAGYAVDQIKGLMEKTADTGYVMSTEQTKMGKERILDNKGQIRELQPELRLEDKGLSYSQTTIHAHSHFRQQQGGEDCRQRRMEDIQEHGRLEHRRHKSS